MRFVHVSQDMEAIGRRFSPERALEAVRDRRDRTYDPALADLFAEHGRMWFEQLSRIDPWDAALELEPTPLRTITGSDLDAALLVVADFIDLKSPAMGGHSRRCAELATRSADLLGFDDGDTERLRRAALVHELGTTAIPNSILDKPGALTRAERDRVEAHPLLFEQMARRSPALAELIPVAACHHERTDGSGYHRHLGADALEAGAKVLAAVDIYVGMTTDRADRPAFADDDAVAELRTLVRGGSLDARSVEAVLVAAGATEVDRPAARRLKNPGGLTAREVEVLRLAARGLTTRDIAERLFISPKTADHHIQHVYAKIGVSTRAAAALWAMQNGIIR
jgi:HD-GYP domain-containing protein (c-di-GMP phosphodiesterase class II)/DNA-binding CsgD family transcriptional regulator